MLHTKRVQLALDKGQDMTLEDIRYLIRREVSIKEIAEALNMSVNSRVFKRLVNNALKVKVDLSNISFNFTEEGYLKCRQAGLSLADIAKIAQVNVKKIENWKYSQGIRDSDYVKKGLLSCDQLRKSRVI